MTHYLSTTWQVDTAPEHMLEIRHRTIALPNRDTRAAEDIWKARTAWAKLDAYGTLMVGAEEGEPTIIEFGDVRIFRHDGTQSSLTLGDLAGLEGGSGYLGRMGFGIETAA